MNLYLLMSAKKANFCLFSIPRLSEQDITVSKFFHALSGGKKLGKSDYVYHSDYIFPDLVLTQLGF